MLFRSRAYRIADNQIALNSGWDDALLSAEVARLKEDGVDLELLGFPEDELDLTGSFWTKRFVRNRVGKEPSHAEEEVQLGADCDAASAD